MAMGVGVAVGLFGVQYAFNSVRDKIRVKEEAVDSARSENENLDRIFTTGKIATRKLEQLQTKSLPTRQEKLVQQYRNWLNRIAEDAGVRDIEISTPDRPSDNAKAYDAYLFTLRGQCRTDEWLQLQAAFYDADFLHSIKSQKFTLTGERDVVSFTLDAQAVALASASPEQEPTGDSSGRLAMSGDEYQQAILNRNPFSPPNNPPKLTSEKSLTFNRGKSDTVELKHSDAEGHLVTYELAADSVPEGLRLNGNKLTWDKPSETGKTELQLRIIDSGWPSKVTEERLVLNVVDPPPPEPVKPPPPKFDVATQAYISFLGSGRFGNQASIRSRTEGKTEELVEGSEFEIGTIKARVVSIHPGENFIELETDGKHWTVDMDTSLADAYAKSQVD